MMSNSEIINVVKEITIAMIANDQERSATATTGKCVADFMQAIYDKVVELNAVNN